MVLLVSTSIGKRGCIVFMTNRMSYIEAMKKDALDEWYDDSVIFKWKEYEIIYKLQVSEKPWLLLIHGFPTASYDWHKVWAKLSSHFSLVTLDMLGFGYSDKPNPYPYSILGQADIIEELLSHLSISRLHLISHDYGDSVAQELLHRSIHKEGVDIQSICLTNGGIFPESYHPLVIQKLLMSPLGFILSSFLNQKKFNKSLAKIFGPATQLSDSELDLYWRLVAHKNGHRIAHLLIRYMSERVKHRERWVNALQNFKGSKGLINGIFDPISGQVMVDRYREIISTDKVWTLDGIGHYPQLEASDEVVACYLEFMRS